MCGFSALEENSCILQPSTGLNKSGEVSLLLSTSGMALQSIKLLNESFRVGLMKDLISASHM